MRLSSSVKCISATIYVMVRSVQAVRPATKSFPGRLTEAEHRNPEDQDQDRARHEVAQFGKRRQFGDAIGNFQPGDENTGQIDSRQNAGAQRRDAHPQKTNACPVAGVGLPCHPFSNFHLWNVRHYCGTLGAFVACAVQRGNAIVISPARQYGDITKRRARQYFRADALAGRVFRIAPVNRISRQVAFGTYRPR